MAHMVTINDERGDIVDARYYCSDYCASTDSLYAGWNGCHELQDSEPCASCGEVTA